MDPAGNPSLLQADFQFVPAQHQPLFGRLLHPNIALPGGIQEGEFRSESGFDGTHPTLLAIATRDHRLLGEERQFVRRDLHVSEERRVSGVSVKPHPLGNHFETLVGRRQRNHTLQGDVPAGDLELHRGGDADEIVAPELHRVA